MGLERVIVEADGGSRGNPGPAGYGALLRDRATGAVIAEAAESIGHATNNVAEYRGLIAGLELFRQHAPTASLEVRMDSKLVIEQMAGRWKVKHPGMKPLAIAAQRLAPAGTVWTWIPREQNGDADRLANLAMDAAARGGRGAVKPAPEGFEKAVDGTGETEPVTAARPQFGWTEPPGEVTRLIFLRHGVTEATTARLFSGPGGADPALTEEGKDQALRAAVSLSRLGGVTAIISSPLRRARETASAVSSALGLDVAVDAGFQEAAYGQWDGHTVEEVAARWPAELEAWKGSAAVAPPGGESLVHVQERVEQALRASVAAHPGHTVVVVSHVNPIKLSVRYCLDAPLPIVTRLLVAPASLTTLWFSASGASALHQFSAVP
jgi:probable phosphoglycerate mutase